MSKFNSKVIELSESKSGNYFDITGRLCYLDDFNANGIMLKSSDKLQSNIDTLVNMPVVAYYEWDWDGNENLGGHEAYQGMDGKLKFGTSAVGTHTKVWIQNDMVKPVYSEIEKELPCIYATARVWTRFENFSRVIKKLYYEGNLYSSWELEPKSIKEEESDIQAMPNPRSTEEWEFLSNCLLGFGNGNNPAYGDTSKVMELSSEQKSIQKELSEALAKDLEIESKKQEGSNKDSVERSANMEKTIAELQAQLSEKDEAIKNLEATVSELSNKVSGIEQSEQDKKNLEKSELEEKLIKATETIEALSTKVAELEPFKAQVEAIEAEKAELEKAEKIEQLKSLATEGDFIKVEEFETSEELKSMLENLDENGIKLVKAERVLSTIQVEKSTDKKVETSAKQELSEKEVNKKDFMSEFLGLN